MIACLTRTLALTGVAVTLLSVSANSASADFFFGAVTSAEAGTTEALENSDNDFGLIESFSSANYSGGGGDLGFSGQALGIASFYGDFATGRAYVSMSTNAVFSGDPVIGFQAIASVNYVELFNIFDAQSRGIYNVSAVLNIHGGVAFDQGSAGLLHISINSDIFSNPISVFDLLIDSNDEINQTVRVPMHVEHLIGADYSASLQLTADAHSIAGPEGAVSSVIFDRTLTILGFDVTDADGNPVDASITTATGLRYAVNPQVNPQQVPEPTTWTMLLTGCVTGIFVVWRQRRVERRLN